MTSRFIMPRQGVNGQNLTPEDGAKLIFWSDGLTTDKNTYTDEAKSTISSNPVIADANGLFESIWLDGDYSVTLRDKNNVQLWGPETVREVVNASDITLPALQTAVELIATATSTPALNDIIEVSGYTTPGDGGGATWRHNGVTGQSASQTPAQLVGLLLNDASGNQWTLVIDGPVNVLSFGVIGDYNESAATGTDNWNAINAGMEGLGSGSGGTLFFPQPSALAYGYGQAIRFKYPNVTIECENSDTIMICTGTTNPGWPNYGNILMGSYTTANAAKLTHYAVTSTAIGDRTLSITGGHVFTAGEVILVSTSTTFTVGSAPLHTAGELNVAVSQAGSTVTLRHPINQASLVQVASLSDDASLWEIGAVEQPITQWAPRDCKLLGGHWKTAIAEGPFRAAGGFIDCVIAPDKTTTSRGVGYGNLAARSRMTCGEVHYSQSAVELAYLSHNNDVILGSVNQRGVSLTNNNSPVRLNEGGHANFVKINNLNTANSDPVGLVKIAVSHDNVVEIGSITSLAATYKVVVFSDTGYTGTTPDTARNSVKINSVHAPGIGGGVIFTGGGQCFDNRVSINCDTTVGNDAVDFDATSGSVNNLVYNSNFESGGVVSAIGGNKVDNCIIPDGIDDPALTAASGISTTSSKKLMSVRQVVGSNSATTTPFIVTSTVVGGALQEQDTVNLSSAVATPGSAATTTVLLEFAGSTIYSHVTAATSAFISVELELSPNSAGTIVFANVKIIEDTAIAVNRIVNITSLNLSATDYDLVMTTTASANTAIVRRTEITSFSYNAGEI